MRLSQAEVVGFGKIQTLSKIAVIAIDETLNIKYINCLAKSWLGLSKKESLKNKSIIEFHEKFNLSHFLDKNNKASKTNSSLINDNLHQWEKVLIHVENEQWWLLTGHTIVNNKIISISNNKMYLNSIIENFPELIYWKDVNFTYQGCNKNVANILGYKSPLDIIGKTDIDLAKEFNWNHDRVKRLRDNDTLIIKKGKDHAEEDPIPLNDVLKIYLTSKKPLYSDGKIIGILGLSTDITARIKMEEDLKQAKKIAEAADHSKTEFIANMSHDIRTPLSGVVGLANILENELQDPHQKSLAHDLAQSGHELLNMLNEILDAVSADNINTNDLHEAPFHLHQLIQGIVDLEKSSIYLKKIQLIVHIDDRIPRCLVSDHKKIHHILLNLVGNAIKYTCTGHVSIEVTLLEKQLNTVSLQFNVTDTGKGMPPEALDKIFDAFYRVTASYKGLENGHGLGLHIAQTYAQLLGGEITVQSKLNEGSTFSFTLPLQIADEKVAASFSKSRPTASSKTLLPAETTSYAMPHILIVEDNHIALTIAKTLLINAKIKPTPATDGETAFELAQTQPFDLILTDIGLPGISGIELTKKIRDFEKQHHKNPVPIIALTAHGENKINAECIEAGMNEVVIKPITTEIIEHIIHKFLRQHHTQTI